MAAVDDNIGWPAIRDIPQRATAVPKPVWGVPRVVRPGTTGDGVGMATTKQINNPDHSAAWSFQVKVSFVVSLTGLILGIVYLPVDPWVRAYLAVAALYSITSAISLSKTLRDEHESTRLVNRIDEVKLERFLADHDPFKDPFKVG